MGFTIEETLLLLNESKRKHTAFGKCIVPKCQKKATVWFATDPIFVCRNHTRVPTLQLQEFALKRLVKFAKEKLPNLVQALKEAEAK